LTALYVLGILVFKDDVATGWPSLTLLMSGMFFVVCLVLALLSEYVVQIHTRVIHRPPYVIASEHRSQTLSREKRLNVVGPQVPSATPAAVSSSESGAESMEAKAPPARRKLPRRKAAQP